MKKIQIMLAVLIGSVLAVASASAQSTTQGCGTVVRVEGIASYSLGDGNWHPLVGGQHLPPGSLIRTGHNGVADVVLGKAIPLPQADWRPDRISPAVDSPVRGLVSYKPTAEQNVVRVQPESTLAIDKLTITDTGADTVGDTEISLTKGKIFASVKKLSGASQYIVKLPNGVAGVRGTLFSIDVNGVTAVFESHNGGLVLSLTFAGGNTKTFLVTPGFELDPVNSTSSPVNISPAGMRELQIVFAAVRTIYQQVVDFSFDRTTTYVSTTRGGPSGGSSSEPSF